MLIFLNASLKVDPGEEFWTDDEIAEEQRLYGKDDANETLEKLFQVRRERRRPDPYRSHS